MSAATTDLDEVVAAFDFIGGKIEDMALAATTQAEEIGSLASNVGHMSDDVSRELNHIGHALECVALAIAGRKFRLWDDLAAA